MKTSGRTNKRTNVDPELLVLTKMNVFAVATF